MVRPINAWMPSVLKWFVKGAYSGAWVGDVVTSPTNANDKRYHKWGQSEPGMAELIERFTLPGQTILDPFLGGGTAAVVALKLGRRFIGIDSDEAAIEMTKARLSSA
jgi:DNA modification methylase